MAYKKDKTVTTAEQQAAANANAVKNYGSFSASDRTNQYGNYADQYFNNMINYGDFTASGKLKATEQKKINAENALANYGDFNWNRQGDYDSLFDKYLNREDFSYDVNGDALYQQYKDQYTTLGNLAMMDTMGQAAAMNGGYGSSYAQSVGQQAYQGYLQQLNDKVPELYELAYNKYTQEGRNMENQLSLLGSDRSAQYGEWADGRNFLVADRDYYGNDYYNLHNQEYGMYIDKYGRLVDGYNAASDAYNTGWNQDYTSWEGGLNQLVDQRDYATKQALNLYDQGYTSYIDGVSDDQWNKEFAEAQRQFNLENGITDNNNDGTPDNQQITSKANNGNVSNSNIIAMQNELGVTPDGKWGPKTQEAALKKWGTTSADEALTKYQVGGGGTKGWKDHDATKLEENKKAKGGSYYADTLDTLKEMKKAGKKQSEALAYLEELVGENYISRSEYLTLANKWRDGKL